MLEHILWCGKSCGVREYDTEGDCTFFFLDHLLIPALVPFQLRKKLEFVDIWTGTYCTFTKDKSGHIYVFGLNNYNQLGEYGERARSRWRLFILMSVNPTGLEQQKSHFHPSVSPAFDGREWISINGGQHHTLALDKDGSYLFIWFTVFIGGKIEMKRNISTVDSLS